MSTAGAAGHMSPDELAYADQWMYDYTPYGNYVQFWSPSRWLYSLKSLFTDDEFMAPWNKRNPGVSDNQYVNTGIDLLTAFLPFVSKKIRFGKANPTKAAQTEPRVRVIPESSEVANERRSVVSTLRYRYVEDSFIKEGLTPHPELFEGRGLYLPDESVIYDYARKSKDYPLTAMFLNDISTEQGMQVASSVAATPVKYSFYLDSPAYIWGDYPGDIGIITTGYEPLPLGKHDVDIRLVHEGGHAGQNANFGPDVVVNREKPLFLSFDDAEKIGIDPKELDWRWNNKFTKNGGINKRYQWDEHALGDGPKNGIRDVDLTEPGVNLSVLKRLMKLKGIPITPKNIIAESLNMENVKNGSTRDLWYYLRDPYLVKDKNKFINHLLKTPGIAPSLVGGAIGTTAIGAATDDNNDDIDMR